MRIVKAEGHDEGEVGGKIGTISLNVVFTLVLVATTQQGIHRVTWHPISSFDSNFREKNWEKEFVFILIQHGIVSCIITLITEYSDWRQDSGQHENTTYELTYR